MIVIENNSVELIEKEDITYCNSEDIRNLIYTIRGKQVMLDSDVAMLYHYETKNINKAMKRNIERFPDDFCFQLTEKEAENLRFQFGTSSLEKENYGGILKNEIAIQVSISIIRAFIEMRKFIVNNSNIFNRLTTVEYKLLEHDKKFNEVFNEIQRKEDSEFKQKIFFNGQIYDAYSLIINIIKSAKTKILIIDNYIDDSILEMLTKKNKEVKVVILTSNKTNISKLDIQKFNEEYQTLEVAQTDKFHDRFITIDNKDLYHIGASLKDLGKKCFAISKIEDMDYIEKIQNFSKNN